MTDDEIKIVIAETCGWKLVGYGKGFDVVMDDPQGNRLFGSAFLPNYPNDLNAIHAEVKKFNLPTLRKFSNHLKGIVEDRLCVSSAVDARYMTLQADASWWCEAFIKTVCPEKWKE